MEPNPIILDVQGQKYLYSCVVGVIIWEGATSSGDTVELKKLKQGGEVGDLLWAARTDATQTYLGINLSRCGVSSRYGFQLTQHTTGRVLVYRMVS